MNTVQKNSQQFNQLKYVGVIHQIMFGYVDLYILLLYTIKSDMKTAPKRQ